MPNQGIPSFLGDRLEGHRRLLGFALYRADGSLAASGKDLEDFTPSAQPLLARVLAGSPEISDLARADDQLIHIFVRPLGPSAQPPSGALVAFHEAGFLEERTNAGLMRSAFWIVLACLALVGLFVFVTWFVYERPLQGLADWMKRLRMGEGSEAPPLQIPLRSLAEESNHLAASLRAVRSASLDFSRQASQSVKVWTRDRLRTEAVDTLGGGPLIVVSNREPYMHVLQDGRPKVIVPASGVVTALDPVLQACGGIWVAHGSGDADRETSDSRGRLAVPPEDPRYTLLRVWLSKEEEQGYYYGFSNEGLWPLCHLAHERPVFRDSDWKHYVAVNRQFARSVLDEVGGGRATVLVQDYHLALVPQLLKEEHPELKVGLFWHIPWPNPEAFRICPWREELLRGMLGADLLGFHLQQHCNNFLDTVDRMVQARLDWDRFSADLGGHTARVRPFPISVESWSERGVLGDQDLERRIRELRELHKLTAPILAVGVERIDYTKGLPERFRAVGRFLETNPEYRGRFTLVQLGAPSRTHIRRYRDLQSELESQADEINWRFQTDDWKPIRFLVAHHDAQTVHAFLSMGSICIISSLHDGMNLVAKEFIAAQERRDGVLILSEFAGAARELVDALLINPYDTEQFARAIRSAVEMGPDERKARMARMHRIVQENNVYRWAGDLLRELSHAPSRVATPT